MLQCSGGGKGCLCRMITECFSRRTEAAESARPLLGGAASDHHRQALSWPERYPEQGFHLKTRLEIEAESPDDRRKCERRFLEREGGADTNARACTEGQI